METEQETKFKPPCVGRVDIFFPSTSKNTPEIKEAKDLCYQCPIQKQCFLDALNSSEYNGIWGGVNFSRNAELRKAKKYWSLNANLPPIR
jgi:hypothetical protein